MYIYTTHTRSVKKEGGANGSLFISITQLRYQMAVLYIDSCVISFWSESDDIIICKPFDFLFFFSLFYVSFLDGSL